jgi:hypothetical protein
VKFGRPRALSVAQQYVNLKSNPVSTGAGRLRAGKLVWSYDASPSTLSRTYRIRIEMGHDLSPDIFVEAPDLHEFAEGRPLPHVYQQDPVRLCLYLPGTPEWRPWMRLDQTVVPWTSLWLFYFEDWLASNEWKGGGKHPQATSETRYGRRRSRSRTTTAEVDDEVSRA